MRLLTPGDRWHSLAARGAALAAAGRINDVPCLDPSTWAELEICWDKEKARFRIADNAWHELPHVFPTRNGISYVYLQSAASKADPFGVLIESVAVTAAKWPSRFSRGLRKLWLSLEVLTQSNAKLLGESRGPSALPCPLHAVLEPLLRCLA
jgi:hypothetical protein